MKLAVTLVACLLVASGSQGFLLDSLKDTFNQIGSAFKTTFSQVGEQAKTVGNQLLDQLKEQGTQLAGQALQSLMLGGMQALQSGSQTPTRRELSDIYQSLSQFIAGKTDEYKNLLNTAIDGLTAVGSIIPKDSKLTSVVSTVDELVHSHNVAANKLTDEVIEGIVQHFAKALQVSGHKRNAFTDLLGKIGSSVATLFQPAVESGKNLVSALGETVKQTAAQTATTAQPHVDSMTQSGQMLVQHGKNALQALKDAVTDILQQTVQQMTPHLQNIATHATQLAVSSGHQLISNLGASVLGTQSQPVVN